MFSIGAVSARISPDEYSIKKRGFLPLPGRPWTPPEEQMVPEEHNYRNFNSLTLQNHNLDNYCRYHQ